MAGKSGQVQSAITESQLIKQSESKTIQANWLNFVATYGALQTMFEHITKTAEEFDQRIFDEVVETLAEIFNDEKEVVRDELRDFYLLDNDIYPDFSQREDFRQNLELLKDSSFKRRLQQWCRQNPKEADRLTQMMLDCQRRPPVLCVVLRQSIFISLIAALEYFWNQLIFSSEESNIRWPQRWEFFEDCHKLPEKIRQLSPQIKEMIERRNILIHKAGKIDANYMKKDCKPPEAKEGRIILVSTAYLEHCFDVVLLFAVGLCQCKWQEVNHNAFEKAMRILTYQLLQEGKWERVCSLSEVLERLEIGKASRYGILVYHAFAAQKLGKNEEFLKIMQKLERKKLSLQIQIARSILMKDFTETKELFLRKNAKQVLNSLSRRWVLFEEIRNKGWFESAFVLSNRGKLPTES